MATQKPRRETWRLYSYCATNIILFILGFPFIHNADKDFIQAGRGDFKAFQVDTLLNQCIQEILGRNAFLRSQFEGQAVFFNRGNPRHALGQIGIRVDEDGIGRKTITNFMQVPIQQNLAFVDQNDAVAEGFNLVHLVGGHDDGLASLALFAQDILDQLRIYRVEGAKGLINNEDLRVVN